MSNDSASGGYLLPQDGTPTLEPDDPFDTLIQSIVVGVTGMPGDLVRPRWQPVPLAEPEPGTDWCAIGVTGEDPDGGRPFVTHFVGDVIGGRELDPGNGGGRFVVGTSRVDGVDGGDGVSFGDGVDFVQANDTASILASFYGPNARGNASALRMGLCVAQNREALQRAGMGLVAMPGGARFIPAIVSMQTQRRVDISFEIRRPNTIEVAVRNLLAVKVVLYPDNHSPQIAIQDISSD